MADNDKVVIREAPPPAVKANNNGVEDLSFQRRTVAQENVAASSPIFWFGSNVADDDIAPWWIPARDRDLREFWMREGNDILQGAISSMVKKFKAMSWALEGPGRVVSQYQPRLANAEFGAGWGELLGKTYTDYATQDKGGFWELIGAGDPDGPLIGPVLGIAHLDSGLVQLTGDPIFPIVFNNTKDNLPRKIHITRMVHLVDMPSPSEVMVGVGFCAVSRVISSSQVLLKLAQYKNEKLSDLPEAGLLLLNNIIEQHFADAEAKYERQRRKLGHTIWANLMTLFGIDPAQPATAELISFANLPDAFDERQTIDIYANIVALAFGVDVREFWPLSAGALGTAAETLVQHQKARGKGVGEFISAVERAINWKILPASVTFKFDFRNDEEDRAAAEIDQIRTDTIMSMWRPGDVLTGEETPVFAKEIRQMLADNVSYFLEDFLIVDVTDEVTATDTEQKTRREIEQLYGPRVRMTREGRAYLLPATRHGVKAQVDRSLEIAEQNWRDGLISAEQIAEYALAELVDRRGDGKN